MIIPTLLSVALVISTEGARVHVGNAPPDDNRFRSALRDLASKSEREGSKVGFAPRVEGMFIPALGEDLTMLVLQYALYDREAVEKLTLSPCPDCILEDGTKIEQWMFCPRCDASGTIPADPSLGLARFYRPKKFTQEGVEVLGAGSAYLNGWYRRREADEGPPGVWRGTDEAPLVLPKEWIQWTKGRPWFEKDDGSFIWSINVFIGDKRGTWWCCDERAHPLYHVETESALPPAAGWVVKRGRRDGKSPPPTLRVVS